MDGFVLQIQNNISNSSKVYEKNDNLRALLQYMIKESPKAHITEVKPDGDVHFEVSLKDLGITEEILAKYRKEIFSFFVTKFIGELIVRENVNEFTELLLKIEPAHYTSVVNVWEYRRFGFEISSDHKKAKYVFHISLIQTILTEDFEKQIRKKL